MDMADKPKDYEPAIQYISWQKFAHISGLRVSRSIPRPEFTARNLGVRKMTGTATELGQTGQQVASNPNNAQSQYFDTACGVGPCPPSLGDPRQMNLTLSDAFDRFRAKPSNRLS